MTTIAFDGKTLAADSLAVDGNGLMHYVEKIKRGDGFFCGAAGPSHAIKKWWIGSKDKPLAEVLQRGMPDNESSTDDVIQVMLVTLTGEIFYTVGQFFEKNTRQFLAIGSGRDFAMSAMYLGESATSAIEVAKVFDHGTGGAVHAVDISKRNYCRSAHSAEANNP